MYYYIAIVNQQRETGNSTCSHPTSWRARIPKKRLLEQGGSSPGPCPDEANSEVRKQEMEFWWRVQRRRERLKKPFYVYALPRKAFLFYADLYFLLDVKSCRCGSGAAASITRLTPQNEWAWLRSRSYYPWRRLGREPCCPSHGWADDVRATQGRPVSQNLGTWRL